MQEQIHLSRGHGKKQRTENIPALLLNSGKKTSVTYLPQSPQRNPVGRKGAGRGI